MVVVPVDGGLVVVRLAAAFLLPPPEQAAATSAKAAGNLPRIAIDHQRIAVNGLYRHGFLLAPALAELTLGYVERGAIDNEVMQCA